MKADSSEPSTEPTYTPTMRPEYWQVIRDFVLAAIADAENRTPYSRNALGRTLADFVLWCWQAEGLPLDRNVMFTRPMVALYAQRACGYLTAASRGNRRSILLGTVPILTKSLAYRLPPIPKSNPTTPYDSRDVLALLSWARGQSTGRRRASAHMLISLGLGGGLTAQEIIEVQAVDIHMSGEGVDVHVAGTRARVVPIHDDWASMLMAAVPGTGAFPFRPGRTNVYPNVISNFLARSRGPGLRPQPQRMRSTWLVRHLDAGVPNRELMQAAGVETLEAFARYIPFTTPCPRPIAQALLRGRVQSAILGGVADFATAVDRNARTKQAE